MKKNELAEIKKTDINSIKERVKKAKMEIVSMVLDKNTNKLTNLRALKNKRREMAQMQTVLRQKQLVKELEEANA